MPRFLFLYNKPMGHIFSFAFNNFLSFLIALAYLALAVGTTIHILIHKDDIKSSIGWIGLVFLSPFIGTVLYIFLGINRVKRKGIKLRKHSKHFIKKENVLFENIPENYKQFIKYGYNVYPRNFTLGNSITPLQNGTQAYPEMIEAINNAKKEVLVQSYIFENDSETDKLLEAFKNALVNGISVKVLIDGVGTFKLSKEKSIEKKLSEIKGLEYGVFLPLKFSAAFPLFNLRNHRKLMVIDSKIAFFGGMNLAAANTLIYDKKKGVIDITFKAEGPIAEQIRNVFEEDWKFVKKKKLHSLPIQKDNMPTGVPARIIPDGPDEESGKIELITQGMINFAKKKILIVTPYFLPENNILTSLEMAAMRGVDVEIIIPQKNDHSIMEWAREPNLLRLSKSGVQIYLTPPPFDHSKFFVIDDELVLVGSSNWDARSFKLLFEADMEIISKETAGQLAKIAQDKKKKAILFDTKAHENLNFLKRLRNNACRLITPYY
ncbi:MAG: phospholipase D-like domain-containing protein [Endomicrobia bacterium]|nr:phospholipase D-like domain-containing protein [Endomicrobiia bacterium]MCL2506921.1 phospholipase D-like domain-containing protein [Endomicrobiia bacterium]